MLELKNIIKIYEIGKKGDINYQQVHALKGVNISFGDNEFVSILGPSGCGKTTLLNIVGGLDKYTDGDLIINGVSTKQYKDSDWDNYRNHKIGFVFQSYNLIPHQTVLENVELALTLSGVNKKDRKNKAIDALSKVGLKDKINAKPSQLSGGQMQRVAIARAIVNNPDIILADEPTGALDTQTSVQIMDLLKEISKEKLIIMVTHNPELAKQYSTRIIKLLDGNIIDDSSPFIAANIVKNEEKKEVKKEKTSMSFLTALSLSGRNLLTKKGRTILVSFAGSIGIIGISLILSLSSGFQNYVNQVQQDTLSNYPLTIQKDVTDYSSLLKTMLDQGNDGYYVEEDGSVHAKPEMVEMFSTIIKETTTNNLSAFKKYIDENEKIFNPYTIKYSYNMNLNVYNKSNYASLNPTTVFSDLLAEISNALAKAGKNYDVNQYTAQVKMLNNNVQGFTEMLDNQKLLESQYNLVGKNSKWPTNYDECVLVINKDNTLNDYNMYALGFVDSPSLKDIAEGIVNQKDYNVEIDPIKYENLLNKKFKILVDTDYYIEQSDGTYKNQKKEANVVKGLIDDKSVGFDLKIVGIVKPNETAVAHSISAPIGYTSKFVQEVLTRINNSKIVKQQKDNPTVDVLTGKEFPNKSLSTKEKKQAINNEIDLMKKNQILNKLKNTEYYNYVKDMNEIVLKATLKNIVSNQATDDQIDQIYNELMGTNTYENNMKKFGVNDLDNPKNISFYCNDFEAKNNLEKEIKKYNKMVKADKDKGESYVIAYSDYVALMMSSISTIIDSISYVLIAFVSVSLVVSSIMIGIITYISVLERTKEIGVLRSIGASKADIRHVFTAESLIIGFISGLFGIVVTIILNIPINVIITHLANIPGVASLPIGGAIILVLLSCFLTFIAGLIPSKIASKKDPVIALRSE